MFRNKIRWCGAKLLINHFSTRRCLFAVVYSTKWHKWWVTMFNITRCCTVSSICGINKPPLLLFVVLFILKTSAFIIHNKLKTHVVQNDEKQLMYLNTNEWHDDKHNTANCCGASTACERSLQVETCLVLMCNKLLSRGGKKRQQKNPTKKHERSKWHVVRLQNMTLDLMFTVECFTWLNCPPPLQKNKAKHNNHIKNTFKIVS